MLVSLLSLVLAAAALPDKLVEAPKGLAPLLMVATYGTTEDGEPYLEVITTRYVLESRDAGELDERKRTETVLTPVQVVTRFLLVDKSMTIYTSDGKRIDLKSVPRLLPRTSPVFVSADGKEVDAFYRNGMGVSTLIIICPSMARAATAPVDKPNPPRP